MRKIDMLIIALASVFAITVMAAPAKAEQAIHKSYVCKYVGQPGVDERLQTGRNPIWVDNHSLLGYDGTTYVGQEFSDKHGKSVVIVANTPKLNPEPSVSNCPKASGPTPTPTETLSESPEPTETPTTAAPTETVDPSPTAEPTQTPTSGPTNGTPTPSLSVTPDDELAVTGLSAGFWAGLAALLIAIGAGMNFPRGRH